jgi:hypothetical protein
MVGSRRGLAGPVLLFLAGIAFVVFLIGGAGNLMRPLRRAPRPNLEERIREFQIDDRDLEVLNVDDADSMVTFRYRPRGWIVRVPSRDARAGRLMWSGPDGRRALLYLRGTWSEVGGPPPPGVHERVVFGAGADAGPAWVPRYPGARITPGAATQGAAEISGAWEFETDASPDTVRRFFAAELERAGLAPRFTPGRPEQTGTWGTLVAADDLRSATVILGARGRGTHVEIQYRAVL